MNDFQADIDLLCKLNSVDDEALMYARGVLDIIKETDPGFYDEMIDECLALIGKALDIDCQDAIDRIAEELGVQV